MEFLLRQKNTRGIIEEHVSISSKAAVRDLIAIGDYSTIADNCWIKNAIIGRFCRIEKKVQVGQACIFPTSFSNHSFCFGENKALFPDAFYQKITTDRFFYEKNPLTYIGNDVRIGENSIIFSGVRINNGALIYPNSVVASDIPPYAIAAGNPARVIDYRFPQYQIDEWEALDWTQADLTTVFKTNRINYLNTDHIRRLFLRNQPLPKREIKEYFLNSAISKYDGNSTEIAILGPSHIYNWIKGIESKKMPDAPYMLYGEAGLAVSSKSIESFLDWWINQKHKKAVLLVPDFRIGNAKLVSGDETNARNAIFIDPEVMSSPDADLKLKQQGFIILDKLCRKYNSKLKLIFWCLYGREQTNIAEKKYIDSTGNYNHPSWTYLEMKTRYKNHLIDISDLGQEMLEIIEKDGSIHPTPDGYQYLHKKIQNAFI